MDTNSECKQPAETTSDQQLLLETSTSAGWIRDTTCDIKRQAILVSSIVTTILETSRYSYWNNLILQIEMETASDC